MPDILILLPILVLLSLKHGNVRLLIQTRREDAPVRLIFMVMNRTRPNLPELVTLSVDRICWNAVRHGARTRAGPAILAVHALPLLQLTSFPESCGKLTERDSLFFAKLLQNTSQCRTQGGIAHIQINSRYFDPK